MCVERLRGRGRMAAAMVRGLILACLVTAVILLILAFVVLKLRPDAGKTEIGILVTYVLSCFAGGWYGGRKAEKKKFLWGLLLGTLYFLLLFAVSGTGDRAVQSDLLQSVTALALCAGGGMLGGMAAS